MTFSEALELMKQGKKIRRSEWEDPGHYLDLTKDQYIVESSSLSFKLFGKGIMSPHTFMYWPDILAEDWEEYVP